MSYEDSFLFLWYPTRHIFTIGSSEKRGAEKGALTKLWMALNRKQFMKNTHCNDLFELKANKRTPLRPPFPKHTRFEKLRQYNSFDMKHTFYRRLQACDHQNEVARLIEKKWKLKKLKLQKIAMWFYFKQSAVKYEPDGLWG